jgi:lysophospholipid acyltransferase (LPLAT)-like uncharacterized protein
VIKIKLRKSWQIRPVGTLAANAIRLIMGTVRKRYAVAGPEPHPPPPDGERNIYAFWHEFLVPMTSFPANAHVLTSLHADGELMTRVCLNLGLKVIRGSSTRGGSAALLGLVRRDGGTHVALTPDGPRGPRRKLKPGAIALAGITGMPILPVGVACSAGWRAGSWDRMIVPVPWSTAYYVVGPGVRVPEGLGRSGIVRYCRLVEAAIANVTTAAERWAAGGPRPVAAAPLAAAA